MSYLRWRSDLTGGSIDDLDGIDGAILDAGDVTIVTDTTRKLINIYVVEDPIGVVESSPFVIIPDTNPGTKGHRLYQSFVSLLIDSTLDAPATAPALDAASNKSIVMGDGAASKGDYNAVIGGKSNIIVETATTNDYGVVVGGESNSLNGATHGAVTGGKSNVITNATHASITGGLENTIGPLAKQSHIGGGYSNEISNSSGYGEWNVIGGGNDNKIAQSNKGAIGGGHANLITGCDNNATIGGGYSNEINGSNKAVISGGDDNSITAASHDAAIGGGYSNAIDDSDYGEIGGGYDNSISGTSDSGVICGGVSNSLYASSKSVVSGGEGNSITSATHAAIMGGYDNAVGSRGDYGSAIGKEAYGDAYGAHAEAAGKFTNHGDAQSVRMTIRNVTTDATETPLFADGASIFPRFGYSGGTSRAIMLKAKVVAHEVLNDYVLSDSAFWEITAMLGLSGWMDAAHMLNTPIGTGTPASGCFTDKIKAQGTITFSGIPVADETITIGTDTYTWKAAAVNSLEVTIGADAAGCVTNLIDAINNDPWPPVVFAESGAGTTVLLTALIPGTGGNSIVLTELSTNVTVDGSGTLGGTTSGADSGAGTASTWSIDLEDGQAEEDYIFELKVTGEAGKTIHWVAQIELVEVG